MHDTYRTRDDGPYWLETGQAQTTSIPVEGFEALEAWSLARAVKRFTRSRAGMAVGRSDFNGGAFALCP
jgi:hypothetical protein